MENPETDTDIFQSLNSFTFPRNIANTTANTASQVGNTTSFDNSFSESYLDQGLNETETKDISTPNQEAQFYLQDVSGSGGDITLPDVSSEDSDLEESSEQQNTWSFQPQQTQTQELSPKTSEYTSKELRHSIYTKSHRNSIFSATSGYSPRTTSLKGNDTDPSIYEGKFSNSSTAGLGISSAGTFTNSKKYYPQSPLSPPSPKESKNSYYDLKPKSNRRSWLYTDKSPNVSPLNTMYNFIGSRNSSTFLAPLSPSSHDILSSQSHSDQSYSMAPKRVSMPPIKNFGHRRSLSISSKSNSSPPQVSITVDEANPTTGSKLSENNEMTSLYQSMESSEPTSAPFSAFASVPRPPPLPMGLQNQVIRDYQINQQPISDHDYNYKNLNVSQKAYERHLHEDFQNLKLNASYRKENESDGIDAVNTHRFIPVDEDRDVNSIPNSTKRQSAISMETFDDCNTSVQRLNSISASGSGSSDYSFGDAHPISMRRPSNVVYLVSSVAYDIDLNVINE
jgi:hypothetical protein